MRRDLNTQTNSTSLSTA